MSTLDDWMAAVADELGMADLGDLQDVRDLVLDVARDVAHAVERPAAPVTAFLLGVAVGRAGEPRMALADHAATVRRLVARWPADTP